MKKVFSILMVMAFVFAGVAQNDEAQPKKNKKVKTPEITFVKLVHDYGQIEQGANGECEFEFKNTGKADLILTNCRSSCGCTVPSWPKDPIPPGKKAVIKVKYNTQRIGQINKTITVESNAVNDRVVLKITGNVNAKATEAAPENNSGAPKVNN
ncbi:MAG: DUF1573 domain-containing protein [Bacteroidales bacterium]|jgi:hypothetical protein|nr:DUF1573 domain-containing protein [Bacteroidales bacterium]